MYFLKYVATPLLRMHIVTNRFKQHITCRAIFTTVSYSVYSINFHKFLQQSPGAALRVSTGHAPL